MQRISKTKKASVWSISVFAIALMQAAFVFNRGIALADDGNMMMAALRVLEGQVPYRDFVHFFYSPGNVYLLSFLFSIFGDSYLVMRGIWALAQALSVLLVFNISRRFVSKPLALLPTAVIFLMPGPWFKAFYPFFALLAFWGISRYLEKPSKGRVCTLGAICAMALFFRQDIGVWASVLSFVVVALNRLLWRPKSFRDFWQEESCLVGVAVGGLLPFLVYMQLQDALMPMLNELFLKSPSLTSSNGAASLRRLSHLLSMNSFLFYVYAFHYVFPFVAFLLLRFEKKPIDRKRIVVLLFLNILTLFPALVSIGLVRVMQSSSLNTILYVVFMYKLASVMELKAGATRRLQAFWKIGAVALYVVMVALPGVYVFDMYNTRGERIVHPLFTSNLLTMSEQTQPFDVSGDRVYLSEEVHQSVSLVVDVVSNNTERNDTIVFFPAQSIFNYLIGQPNPTKLIGVWTHLYRDKEAKREVASLLCAEMEKHNVDVFVLMSGTGPKPLGKTVGAFIDSRYELVVDYPFRLYKKN